MRSELYENLIARAIIDHAKFDRTLPYDTMLTHLEKDNHLANIPQLHVTNAIENMIEKKILTKDDQTLTISKEHEDETNKNIDKIDELRNSILNELKNKIYEKIPDLDSTKMDLLLENFEDLLSSTFVKYGITLAKIFMEKSKSVKSIKGLKGFSEGYVDTIQQIVPKNKRDTLDKIFNQYFFKPSDNLSKYLYALAQSYILIEILNVDPELKKIQEIAWKKKNIYIDTNVLIPLLFEKHDEHESISMIIQNTIKLGAKIIVSETTASEFENKLSNFKKGHLTAVIEKRLSFLEEVEHNDGILDTYLDERSRIPGLSIANFCIKYENYPMLLKKLGTEIEDDYTKSIEEHDELEELETKIKSNSRRKTVQTAFHDAYHILKVRELRKESHGDEIGPIFWFLTADHSLQKVEREMFGEREIFASIMAELWINLISNFLSPNITIDFEDKAFTKLLSSNFISHKIKHEDLTNLMTVFMNDDQFTNNELRIIIGDKFAKDTLRQIKDVLDKGEELTLDKVKPFISRMKQLLTEEFEQKRKTDKIEYDKQVGTLAKKLNTLKSELGIVKEETQSVKTSYSKVTKILIIVLASAAVNAIVSLVLSYFVTLENILWVLLGLLGGEAILVFFYLLKHHFKKKDETPWTRGDKLGLLGIIIGIISIILAIIFYFVFSIPNSVPESDTQSLNNGFVHA